MFTYIPSFLDLKEHSFSKRETLDAEAILNLDCSGNYVCDKTAQNNTHTCINTCVSIKPVTQIRRSVIAWLSIAWFIVYCGAECTTVHSVPGSQCTYIPTKVLWVCKMLPSGEMSKACMGPLSNVFYNFPCSYNYFKVKS